MGNENLTSWLLRARTINKRISDIPLKENKLGEITSLIESGLNTYEFIFYTLTDFLFKETSIIEDYQKFGNRVVVRIVSRNNDYKRYTYIEKDYLFIKEQIERNIPVELFSEYIIVLNIYDPSKYCGVIISSPDRLIIEMVEDENLENLCHGHIIPWHAEFSYEKMHFYRTMSFLEPVPINIKKKIWRVVKNISKVDLSQSTLIPYFTPRVGDFEFVISKQDNSLKFIDFKQTFWKSL